MTLRTAIRTTEHFALIYWTEENSTSVIRQGAILEPQASQLAVGKACTVKVGRGKFSGRIAGLGPKTQMEALDHQFLSGLYDPFGSGPLSEVQSVETEISEPPRKKRQVQKSKNTTRGKKAGKENTAPRKRQSNKKKNKDEPTGTILRASTCIPNRASPSPTSVPSRSPTPVPTPSLTPVPSPQANRSPLPEGPVSPDLFSEYSPTGSLYAGVDSPLQLPTSASLLSWHAPVDMDICSVISVSSGSSSSHNSSDSSGQISESGSLLLNVTVDQMNERLQAAEKRILFLESQVQYLLQIQHIQPPIQTQPNQPYQYNQQPPIQTQRNQPHQYNQQPPIQTQPNQPHQLEQSDYAWYSSPYTIPTPTRRDTCVHPQPGPSRLFSPETEQTSKQPSIVPIKAKAAATYLPSSSIAKLSLQSVAEVIRKYPKLRQEAKAGQLAVKLAKEAFFGCKVLSQCTVSGCRDLPALPLPELNELKQTMLMQFPKYWNSAEQFEEIWLVCIESIGQACKSLRKKNF